MQFDDKVPTQNSQFNLEQMDDENLLYSPSHTKTIYLNSTATLIWNLCDGENTVGQIISTLTEAFPQAKDQLRSDVIQSIDDLVKNQALQLV